ncbi:sporulation protein [Peribacillus cavernae]|uniref:Sporulation protein n=1 Tax=Peribacillus cavernae TaxID=1674310 RepID=A0A3S0VEL4_9BACI|nr:sporulation membrane protein YtrI [Peribacillus cavernae]MDQ0220072.1 putative membrane protein [Peribacillus cavernae]RUQ25439.1 sporulation protein [Peribacillus cavernae]
MRVPPYYREPGWQRFFAGVAIGGIIGWLVFLYMFGILQEKQIQKISNQKEVIGDLMDRNEIWEEDYEKLNEEAERKLKVQEVQVAILNGSRYRLDHLSIAEAEDAIHDDFASLIAKDVETIYNGKALLKKSIENKVIEINKKRYKLEVAEILFYTNMNIEVRLVRL